MGYQIEVIQRARARLAQEKADREAENRQHLAVAYQRIPRLKEIDRQLRMTLALAAQAVFSQGGDAVAAMEEAKQKNLALQRERDALISVSFEEGYLDDSPICDRCGGTGYIGVTMCECLAELCRQEQKKEISVLTGGQESFSQFRLDYYPDRYDSKYGASPRALMESNLRVCRNFASTFSKNSESLLFVGGTGLGKTFLSACIARSVADRGFCVCYETASHLFSKLEQAKFSPNEENRRQAEKIATCDLLIVDDLGTEMPSQFITAALYSLVNDRMIAGLPMVVSTNLTVDEMSRRYSPQIASRLHGGFHRLTFLGDDIRVLKSREL